jgi:hypothetical protein
MDIFGDDRIGKVGKGLLTEKSGFAYTSGSGSGENSSDKKPHKILVNNSL